MNANYVVTIIITSGFVFSVWLITRCITRKSEKLLLKQLTKQITKHLISNGVKYYSITIKMKPFRIDIKKNDSETNTQSHNNPE